MVRICTKRLFHEQRPWVFVGRVEDMTEHWVCIRGKGIVIVRGKTEPVEIDEELRPLALPRDNIANIRLLPDDFDLDNIKTYFDGNRAAMWVDNAPDTWISEGGES